MRTSFALYLVLGPALAIGLALAAFTAMRGGANANQPALSSPTASPSESVTYPTQGRLVDDLLLRAGVATKGARDARSGWQTAKT